MARVTKQIAEQRLGSVSEAQQFWCQDGRVLKSLPELEAALRTMDEDTYCQHVSEARNDFSNWVKDVIGDDKLANDLRKSKARIQAAKNVADRITWLTSKVLAG